MRPTASPMVLRISNGCSDRKPQRRSRFARDRQCCGYRGFAMCRDVDRLRALQARRWAAAETQRVQHAQPDEPAKVLTFRGAPPQPPADKPAPVLTEKAPALRPG